MPLYKQQLYAPKQTNLGLQSDVPVLIIRYTGEIFAAYECVLWPLSRLCATYMPEVNSPLPLVSSGPRFGRSPVSKQLTWVGASGPREGLTAPCKALCACTHDI